MNQYTGPRDWTKYYTPEMRELITRGYAIGFGAGSIAKAYKLKSNDVGCFIKATIGRTRNNEEAIFQKNKFYRKHGRAIMHLNPEEIRQYIEGTV